MVSNLNWIESTLKVVQALEALRVPYVVCGSVASAIHGIPRTTMDSDLVADLSQEHVTPLAAALQSEFYLDEDSMRESIDRRSSFNVIYIDTMFKVDLFIPKARSFDQAQLADRVEMEVTSDPQRKAWFVTAENIVLAKLEWFQLGDQVSERQWRDVLGVLKTQGKNLDFAYMQQMAKTLGVADLLKLALDEAAK
jgi:hypothetical protein